MPKPHRALLIVDVQNEYFSGKLPIAYPPVSSSIPNIARAMDAAGQHGILVILIQHTLDAGAPVFARDSIGWQLHQDVARRPHDLRLEKAEASAFWGTGLDQWLQLHKIDTLTIAGYMTHNCDASTAIEASHRGYHVELLSDASGSLPYANSAGSASAEEIHRVFSVVMHSNFSAVIDTSTWIQAVQEEVALATDNILQSNLRARDASTALHSAQHGNVFRSKRFVAHEAWEAQSIAMIEGASVRLHWTDQPYVWHVNDGEEVFAVMDGRVHMRWRDAQTEHEAYLEAGDIFHASAGMEHVAAPISAARILVIERRGSV